MVSILIALLGYGAVADQGASTSFDAANRAVLQKFYPQRARLAGEEGIVGFSVRLDQKGRPIGCRVTQSSGFPRLDRETCEIVLAKARFKPFRTESGERVAARSEGKMAWVMPIGDLRRADTSKQIRTGYLSDKDEITCKYDGKLGSNFIKVKLCLTEDEWRLSREWNRQEMYRLTSTWMAGS